jgi:pimeloyl-ACP methyl ester carboxylesterase
MRRQFLSRGILVAILTLPTLNCPAQANTDRQIDVGGYKLFVSESGTEAPTVVFEAGLGESSETWNDVRPAIATFAHTVAYDRAGLGKSENSTNPKTVEAISQELHAMLRAAHLSPPYVLVGHSLGGAIIQVYAHEFPNEIAGLVFVDPEDGRLLDRLHSHMTEADWASRQKMLDQMMAQATKAQAAELEGTKVSGDIVSKALPLPDVPTIVLTGTLKDPGFPGNPLEQDLKLQLHQELLASFPRGKQVLAPNSRHYIQNDQPNLVIDAVREVVERSRSTHP